VQSQRSSVRGSVGGEFTLRDLRCLLEEHFAAEIVSATIDAHPNVGGSPGGPYYQWTVLSLTNQIDRSKVEPT
jgi:hypothetical protein